MSPTFAEYLKRELAQVPGMVSGSSDALSHPVFTKAIREVSRSSLTNEASTLAGKLKRQSFHPPAPFSRLTPWYLPACRLDGICSTAAPCSATTQTA